jgi:hypothetical protein
MATALKPGRGRGWAAPELPMTRQFQYSASSARVHSAGLSPALQRGEPPDSSRPLRFTYRRAARARGLCARWMHGQWQLDRVRVRSDRRKKTRCSAIGRPTAGARRRRSPDDAQALLAQYPRFTPTRCASRPSAIGVDRVVLRYSIGGRTGRRRADCTCAHGRPPWTGSCAGMQSGFAASLMDDGMRVASCWGRCQDGTRRIQRPRP